MIKFRYSKIIITLLIIVISTSLFTMHTIVSGDAFNTYESHMESIDIYDTLDNSDWQFQIKDISRSGQRELTDNQIKGAGFRYSIRNINIYLPTAIFYVYLLKNLKFRFDLCNCLSHVLKKIKLIRNIYDKDGKKKYTFAF